MNFCSSLKLIPAIVLLLALSAEAATITGTVKVPRASDNSNAVVYIDKIPDKTFAAQTAPATMDQLNLKFVPHVLTVLAGTRVRFPNSDVVRHNVFSPSSTQSFTLGTYPVNETKVRLFTKPGIVTLLCNIHAEMSAYIVVTATPYSAITDKDGNYSIANVPPGRYVLRVWHEKAARTPPRDITVSGDDHRAINFDLKM